MQSVMGADNQRTKKLEKIAEEVRNCEKCPLYRGRLKAVPGSGSGKSRLVFIGEGPGAQEDKKGEPFVGAAGTFLNEMLESIGLSRDDVFITNVVKCRPPNNRDPFPEEVDMCTESYLWRQLEILDPLIIVTLGRHAMYRFLPAARKISQDHGKMFHLESPSSGRAFNIVAFYHPAAALYNGSMREVLKQDFKRLPGFLKKVREQRGQK